MNTFTNIKELLSALKREEKLLSEMFSKRKTLSFKYEYALDLVDDEQKLQYLIERSVLRHNGNYLEIDDLYLDFFEQVLDVNEEINISYINDNIKNIKENIAYFLNENNENRKYAYLKKIKSTFRKIGIITLKNVIDLRRNIDTTFKNEPNFKNKKLKLTNFDEKRKAITALIEQTERLVNEKEELTFFNLARDEELNRIIIELKHKLNEATHNLIEIEKQIIDYLNQILYQSGVLEKIRKIKYLKDQFILETSTNIRSILQANNDIVFEPNPQYPTKLSINYLNNSEEAFEVIKKIADSKKTKVKVKVPVAEHIAADYLETEEEIQKTISIEALKNSFEAQSADLFSFIFNYDFDKEVDFNDRITLFCQIISQFEEDLKFSDEYQIHEHVEYALIFPK